MQASPGWWRNPGPSGSAAQPLPFSPHHTLVLLFTSFYYYLGLPVGEGNGSPLQYSCLENPMDGGAWWAAVRDVAKSRTGLSNFTFMYWRRKWQPTPVFLPGESQGQGSLVGCHLWGRTELDRLKRLSSSSSSSRPSCPQSLPASGSFRLDGHEFE